jgi:hypothetical protein
MNFLALLFSVRLKFYNNKPAVETANKSLCESTSNNRNLQNQNSAINPFKRSVES